MHSPVLIIAMIGALTLANAREAAGAAAPDSESPDTSFIGARAQTVPTGPGLRDAPPLRIAQRPDIESRLPTSDDERSTAEIQLPPKPELRDGAPDTLFILTAVEFMGVTAFKPEVFAPLYDDLLARAITLEDVTTLVDAVTEVYRKEGYFLSRAIAPAQNAAGGVLQIDVAEGYIEHVKINGRGPARVKHMLDEVKKERPVQLKTVERALTLIGDLNGVTVSSSELQPDANDAARHLLIVDIDVDHAQASLYLDNRGTDAAGPIQAYARVAASSLITTGDQLSAGVFFIPDQPSELILGEMEYQLPVGTAGTYFSVSGAVSKFDAGAFLGTLGTQSTQKSIAANIAHPFIRRRKTSIWGNVGFEARNIEEEQLNAPMFEDRLRIVYGSLNFRDDRLNGITVLSGKVSSGLNMLGASDAFGSLSRPDANGEFTKFNVYASRYQNIGKVFGLYAAFSGQSSMDPLLASEEFAIGGANFGRAYDYGELVGDDGVAALIELRYGRNPDISILDFYQFYGFYDYGMVWNDNALPGFESLSMASAGGGLRLTFPESISVTLELARPLDRTPFTQDDRDWRGFFSVSKTF